MRSKFIVISIAIMFIILIFTTGSLDSQQKAYYSMPDLKWMSYAIYFEARSESTAGQIAVGQVVINRVYSSLFPDTIKDVVTQGIYRNGSPVRNKCAFSFWCDGRNEYVSNEIAWGKAILISRLIMGGTLIDITDGADHYELKDNSPWWSKGMLKTTQIDSHIFYKSTF